ncbi:MAG: hypothetical protein ACR2PW_03345, partial [Gammaproteobacteria bacterium]
MARPIAAVCGGSRGILAIGALSVLAVLPPNAYAAAPTVATAIADQAATEDEAAVTLDVADSFTD